MSDKKYGGYTLAQLREMLEQVPYSERVSVAAKHAFSDLLDATERAERYESVLAFALAHVRELRDAWLTGALSEHDGKGGTRSNRNVMVLEMIRAARCGDNGCDCGGIPEHGGHGHEFSDSCTCCRDTCDGSGVIGGRRKDAPTEGI